MKSDIHPPYYDKVTVSCACGNSFVTGATVETLAVEICARCHPFYTGKQKLIDTAGRVDRFRQRLKEVVVRPAKPKSRRKKAGADKIIKLS